VRFDCGGGIVVDDVNSPAGIGSRRRVVLRRRMSGGSFGGGGFSNSTSTRSESLRASEEPDEIDGAIDPDEAVNRIRTGSMPSPSRAPDAERASPRTLMNQVALAGSSSYAKEFRLELLHKMLTRKIPLHQIAAELQVSISTVEKDRAELHKRLREAAKKLNIDEMVGDQIAVYEDIRSMAMRIATNADTPTAMKLAAGRTALAADADKTRFLNTAGVYDALRFRRSEDGSTVSDISFLMQRTTELMEALNEEEVTPPQKSSRYVKRGGFKPMSFDDEDASGSSEEIQEI